MLQTWLARSISEASPVSVARQSVKYLPSRMDHVQRVLVVEEEFENWTTLARVL